MFLPSITTKLLSDTVNNLWEYGAELNNDVRAGVYGHHEELEYRLAVLELAELATYLDYLQKYDRCGQGMCCHSECVGY